jgi:ribonuclease VapC
LKKRTKKLLSVWCSALEAADKLEISAATFTEALVVAGRRALVEPMRLLLSGVKLTVHTVDAASARRVAEAYSMWGNGVHPARLNIFDCFAVALAREQDAKLPFVGNDFTRTDVASALPPAN